MNFRSTLLTTVLSLLFLSGYGQIADKGAINIGGVTVNNTYTYSQFTSIMGAPDSTKSEMDDGGEHLTMTYNGNRFCCVAGEFICFELINNSYKLNGVVGVGDPVANINLINPFKIESKPNGANKMLYYADIIDPEYDMMPVYFYVTNGIITKIFYLYGCD